MKKSFVLNPLFMSAIIYSSASYASYEEGHDSGHHKHHRPKEAGYYPEQPRSLNYQSPRSDQGLTDDVVGSVLGYEISNGDPIATGLDATAGSYLGNSVAERR